MYQRKFVNYDQYYYDQAGGKLDISYYSAPYQRGRGWLTNLAKKYAVPGLKYLLEHGIKFGKDMFTDLFEGKDVKESVKTNLKRRAAEGMKDFGEKIADKLSGSGLRKKRRLTIKKKRKSVKSKQKKKSKKNSSRKKLTYSRDIFN